MERFDWHSRVFHAMVCQKKYQRKKPTLLLAVTGVGRVKSWRLAFFGDSAI
jgi:hypothetical protein